MVAVVGQPDRVVGRHEHAMGARIDALTPGPQEVSVAVEHDHRVLAAVEDIDVVVAVHADAADFLERPAGGQFCPVLHRFIGVFAAADGCHGRFPFVPCASVPRTSVLDQPRASRPKPANPIGIERLLVGHQHHAIKHGLSDQHPIERVPVQARQCACRLPVRKADRQADKALSRENPRKIATAPGSLPRRNFVATTQAEAALTKTVLLTSPIAVRAGMASAVLPARDRP